MSIFAQRMRELRYEKRRTQTQMAELIGIKLRAYQNYESGRRCPNVSVARLISRELNMPMDDLF